MNGIIIKLLLSALLLTGLNSSVYAQYNSRIQRNSATYTLDDFYVRRRNVNTDKNEKSEKKKKDKEKKKSEKEKTSSQEPLAADDVSLVVSGEGPTKDEATKVALRSAIEQAFGTFVSSNTNILNDELVKDEIVTVSSGNIKSYEYISEDNSNGKYNVVVKAVVSIGKLVSYTQSKGGQTELAGAAFVMDVKMKKLYKENEEKAIEHLMIQLRELFPRMFDYSINVMGNPQRTSKGINYVNVAVTFSSNNNYQVAHSMIWKTLSALCIKTENEVEDLRKKGMNPEACLFYALDGYNTTDLPLKFFKEDYIEDYKYGPYSHACFRSKKIADIAKLFFELALKSFTIDYGIGQSTFIYKKTYKQLVRDLTGSHTTSEIYSGENGVFDASSLFDRGLPQDYYDRLRSEMFKKTPYQMHQIYNDKDILSLTKISNEFVNLGYISASYYGPFPLSNKACWIIKGQLSFTDEELEKISTFKIYGPNDTNQK